MHSATFITLQIVKKYLTKLNPFAENNKNMLKFVIILGSENLDSGFVMLTYNYVPHNLHTHRSAYVKFVFIIFLFFFRIES